jgi:hypothetical protein
MGQSLQLSRIPTPIGDHSSHRPNIGFSHPTLRPNGNFDDPVGFALAAPVELIGEISESSG